MDNSEVLAVVNSVWRYKVQGTLIAPGERAAVVRHADYVLLRGDRDAAALWLDIVIEHQARVHEFALDVQKMSVRLGMSQPRFRSARDGLTLKYGLFDQTRKGSRGPGDPPRFRIARRRRLRVPK